MKETESKEKYTHVFIAIPSHASWKAKFGMSLLSMTLHSVLQGFMLTVQNERYSSAAENRNLLIKKALKNPEVTHVLFLDDDHSFPFNMLERLFEKDKDIVGIAYARKRVEKSTGKSATNIVDPLDNTKVMDLDLNKYLQEVGSVGGGTLLVKREVLESMEYPYFFEDLSNGRVGEDVYFCRRAKELGYKIWIDTDLSLEGGHIGEYEYKIFV
jgi:hypothetical protein